MGKKDRIINQLEPAVRYLVHEATTSSVGFGGEVGSKRVTLTREKIEDLKQVLKDIEDLRDK